MGKNNFKVALNFTVSKMCVCVCIHTHMWVCTFHVRKEAEQTNLLFTRVTLPQWTEERKAKVLPTKRGKWDDVRDNVSEELLRGKILDR